MKTIVKKISGDLTVRSELAIVLAFALLMTLPFVFRPFHMDDAGFIELARVRQTDPTELSIKDYVFFGKQNETFLDTHPPLIASYIAMLMKITGSESETGLHLGFVVFPLIAAASMYFLARRYTRHAMWAALIFSAAPGVVVMSHGVMSDVPGLSMWMAGVTLFVYGLERKSLVMMSLCALAITTGMFISYQVLSIIPLLLLYSLVRREFSLLAVIPFVLPLSSFISYAVWHLADIGSLPRLSYGVGEPLAWYSIVQKGASAALAVAGATIFFAAVLKVLLSRKADFIAYLIFLATLWFAVLIQFASGNYGAVEAILLIVLLPAGLLLFYRIFSDGLDRFRGEEDRRKLADDLLLLVWLSGVLFYVVFLLPYSSVRYLLPALPPLILLFVRLVEERIGDTGDRIKGVLLAATGLTAASGLLIASADYELAKANRDFARERAVEIGRQAAADGSQVWFVGEFGFRYYMEEQGFRELPKRTDLPVGDFIIQSPLADPRPFSKELMYKVEIVEKIGYPARLPLRVTSFEAKAGFYGHFWGILPWSLATGDIEEYLVYRVVEPKDDTGRFAVSRILGKNADSELPAGFPEVPEKEDEDE